jgi:hypothetical protein
MRGHVNRSVFRSLVTVVLAISGGVACACSVPVFRYALEKWKSDTYQVVVFYDGQLTDEQQAVVDSLSVDGKAGKQSANVQVHAFDVKKLDPQEDAELIELWKAEETEELPRMALYFPPNSLAHGRIWSGEPTKDAVDSLLDSPARREAARRILKGETAVWVFIEGGDKKKDDEKFQILERNLRKAERTLKLPEVDAKDVADGLVTIDPTELKIKFSTMRLSRDNPKEATFIQMLLHSEPDLLDAEFDGQPITFPLFGRCRSLYALVGNGIVEGTLLEACTFLIGPCTCEVKAQNEHGVDMLTSVDWDGLIEPAVEIDKELPPLAGLGAFASLTRDDRVSTEPEKMGIHEAAAAASAEAHDAGRSEAAAVSSSFSFAGSKGMLVSVGAVLGLGLIGVIGVSFFLLRRKET